MGKFRIYFQDENRQELTGHRLNGREWTGSGACLSTEGQPMDEAPMSAKKYFSREGLLVTLEFWVRIGADWRVPVTMADFPGHSKIYVKVWNIEDSEIRLMVSDDLVNKLRDKKTKIAG